MEENLEILRNLVILYAKVDPMEKKRLRNIVDAKKMFCLIAFENIRGFKYIKIGEFLGIHHATVIHHVKSAKDLLDSDYFFKEIFIKIESEFALVNKSIPKKDLESEINILSIKLDELLRRFIDNEIYEKSLKLQENKI